MQSGEFDRAIVIEQRTVTQDSEGGDIVVWSTFLTTRAKYKSITSKERFAAAEIRESSAVSFTIRWYPGIKPDDRIVYDTNNYRILGTSEIGRRMYLDITAELFQQSGEAQ